MPIDFRCPSGHKLSVPDALAGRKARCPLCRRKMLVPADNSQPNVIVQEVGEPPAVRSLAASGIDTDSTRHGTLEGPDDWREFDIRSDDESSPLLAIEGLPETYIPDRGKRQTVQLLAAGLAAAALFAAIPALKHWNLASAPDWARLVLLICIGQLVYIAWMVSLPDWTTVWVSMLAFALVATLYGAALAIFMYTPADAPLMLELDESARHSAAGWCMAVVLLTSMMTFVCGRVSAGWRRSIELARRRGR